MVVVEMKRIVLQGLAAFEAAIERRKVAIRRIGRWRCVDAIDAARDLIKIFKRVCVDV